MCGYLVCFHPSSAQFHPAQNAVKLGMEKKQGKLKLNGT